MPEVDVSMGENVRTALIVIALPVLIVGGVVLVTLMHS